MRSTAGHNTKYVWIAYLSWFFLGWAGIHHFYLRRYRQGVLWLTSFGGLFGIGWLRDFLRLPTYVRDANDDPEFIEEFKLELRYSSMNPDRISDDPVGTIGEQSNKDQGHQGVDNNSNGDRNIHGWLTSFWILITGNHSEWTEQPNEGVTSEMTDASSSCDSGTGSDGRPDIPKPPTEENKLKYLLISSGRPDILSNWHRLLGQVLFGALYHGLIYCAIPWDSSVMNYAAIILPLGTAFGTYMVSNVGRQKSHIYYSLIGAYVGEFFSLLLFKSSNPLLVAGFSMMFSTYGWKWRIEKEDVSRGKLLLTVFLVYCLFVFLCGSYMYFNATLETEDGESIKLYDAFNNFYNSPAWQKFKTAIWELYEIWKTSGFEALLDKLKDLADIDGEYYAYDILELEPGTKFEEVRKKYKELAIKWHPDHHQGKEMKMKAQEEFVQYKNAYKVLEKIHKRREKFKKKFRL